MSAADRPERGDDRAAAGAGRAVESSGSCSTTPLVTSVGAGVNWADLDQNTAIPES